MYRSRSAPERRAAVRRPRLGVNPHSRRGSWPTGRGDRRTRFPSHATAILQAFDHPATSISLRRSFLLLPHVRSRSSACRLPRRVERMSHPRHLRIPHQGVFELSASLNQRRSCASRIPTSGALLVVTEQPRRALRTSGRAPLAQLVTAPCVDHSRGARFSRSWDVLMDGVHGLAGRGLRPVVDKADDRLSMPTGKCAPSA